MPDWSYVPLRGAAERLVGVSRSRRSALRLVSTLARLPLGNHLIRSFSFTVTHPVAKVVTPSATYISPIGVVTDMTNSATATALQSMGFGFVATSDDIPTDAVRTRTTDLAEIVTLIDGGAKLVVANEAVKQHGPDTAERVNEFLASRYRDQHASNGYFGIRFWTWPGWVWALWLGIAMVSAGIGAAIITLGPVLLGYDNEFLGVNTAGLDAIETRLVPFLQHDRITMAGCMMAIGANDIGFALAMRRGWRWARVGFGLAGAFGFPTFFLFLGYEFLDPLHLAVAVGFFPLYLLGLLRPSVPEVWRTNVVVDERARRRALVGQFLMVFVALGVTVSGIYIMIIGLTDVLIPSDRAYLGNNQVFFESQLDGRLLRFIAHDRAGFGGALTSLGVGILTISLWGWREGERSTWWTTAAASTIGFGPALSVHYSVGYTDFVHLLPVYLAIPLVGVALLLSREWMLLASTN
jgi:hypothetical protein